MKKALAILITASSILLLTACSQKEENKISNPVTDPVGHTADMIDLKEKMEKNINDAANKENERLNNTLNENNMNTSTQNAVGDNSALVAQYKFALIKTNLGDIKVELKGDAAPVTVENFLKLAKSGFYDGIKFHRVIKNFMIQGGDPKSKEESLKNEWGTGGPGYQFDDELSGNEKYTQGTLAMANAGPNTNGSQFFIVTASPSVALPPSYTVFGAVVSGMDTALKIQEVATNSSDRPLEDVVIETITPLEK